jgi:hypothetical protein
VPFSIHVDLNFSLIGEHTIMYELTITKQNGDTVYQTVGKLLDVETIAILPSNKETRVTYYVSTSFGSYPVTYTIVNNIYS